MTSDTDFILYFWLFEIFYLTGRTIECFGGVWKPEKRSLTGIEGKHREREREIEKRKALESRRKAQCGNSLGHDRHYHNFFSMSPNEGDTECVEGVRRASRQTTGRAKQVGVLERANGVKGHPVYLSVHGSAAGCNLMSFLCWFRLYRVTRVSRSFVFVFRVFQPPPPPPSPLPLFPPLEFSSASDPFKIRLLSCRLGCRRL